MDRRARQRDFGPVRAVTARLALAIVATLTIGLGVGTSTGVVTAATDPPPSVPAGPEVVGTDNEFVPADVNLSECVSALPRPNCGSDAQGGWRQTAIFAFVIVVVAGIGIRIAVAVRRRDRALNAS